MTASVSGWSGLTTAGKVGHKKSEARMLLSKQDATFKKRCYFRNNRSFVAAFHGVFGAERGLPSTPSMRRLGIVKGGVRNFQSDGMLDRASIRTRWSSLRTRCSMKFDLAALLSLSRPLRTGRGLAVAANSVCPFALLRFLNLLQSDVLPSLLQSDVPTCLLRCRPFLFALGDFAADSRHTSGRQAARSGDPLSLI